MFLLTFVSFLKPISGFKIDTKQFKKKGFLDVNLNLFNLQNLSKKNDFDTHIYSNPDLSVNISKHQIQ